MPDATPAAKTSSRPRRIAVTVALLAGLGWNPGPASAASPEIASASIAGAAQIARGHALAERSCAACHGVDGNAVGPQFPKLAGQGASYLERELEHFRAAHDGAQPLRHSPIMNPIAQSLSAQDRADLAAYYASQPLHPALAGNAAELPLGASIWRGGIRNREVPACAACHGADGHGIPPLYPSLAGQWQGYLVSQLRAFRDGTRDDHGPMREIASRMTATQIQDVADFAAGLH